MIRSHGKVPGSEGWLELDNDGSRLIVHHRSHHRDAGEAKLDWWLGEPRETLAKYSP